MKISKNTIIWSLFIITSAFYMRQILNILLQIIGKPGIMILLIVLFLLSGAYIIQMILKRKPDIYIILLLLIILSAGYLYAYNMRILEEKIHIIKYGILGWLVIGDLFRAQMKLFVAIILSLLWCLLVVSVDEGIQHFLPWRVGDMRDVGFAVIGGVWGLLLFITSKRSRPK